MKTTIFWVLFFGLVGCAEILLGMRLFSGGHYAAGMFIGVLGVVALILAAVIGVIG